eukprot:352697-Chlamydomonas_euryale.AAC.2
MTTEGTAMSSSWNLELVEFGCILAGLRRLTVRGWVQRARQMKIKCFRRFHSELVLPDCATRLEGHMCAGMDVRALGVTPGTQGGVAGATASPPDLAQRCPPTPPVSHRTHALMGHHPRPTCSPVICSRRCRSKDRATASPVIRTTIIPYPPAWPIIPTPAGSRAHLQLRHLLTQVPQRVHLLAAAAAAAGLHARPLARCVVLRQRAIVLPHHQVQLAQQRVNALVLEHGDGSVKVVREDALEAARKVGMGA